MTYRVPLNSQDYNVELRDSRLVKKPSLNTLIEEGLGLTGKRVSIILCCGVREELKINLAGKNL